ncbi:hypothetical protein VFPPC_13690 [Pochonia chlamydosporia 170]|uniref:Uncharacterized protein n=1 Tax=Pochonia chlamydosporia 170 TaxID=1380566 RepID=A0A179FTT8_METCM|nr:hypothetical protein VFPPC_13690 [Pochonia chlamydosporia 170]OAQ68503.1 hypothetical protein VFPPC_13690 [Pochonia chlamydosporia 170]
MVSSSAPLFLVLFYYNGNGNGNNNNDDDDDDEMAKFVSLLKLYQITKLSSTLGSLYILAYAAICRMLPNRVYKDRLL